MGRPKRHTFRRYTKTRTRVLPGGTSYYRETDDDEQFVIKILVDEIMFGLKLHDHEYSILQMHLSGTPSSDIHVERDANWQISE